jgi:sugar lactone lactonase YvrE
VKEINLNHTTARVLRRAGVPLLVVGLLIGSSVAATATTAGVRPAAPRDQVITLPGATSAEGIAAGKGFNFYAGDMLSGDIFRGNIRRGSVKRVIDAPEGRMAAGMKVNLRHGLLLVAGGSTGQAYVYSTRTGETVRTYQLGGTTGSFINDVVLTPRGAWFTDSGRAELHFVPIGKRGKPRKARTLQLTGPGVEPSPATNGIEATPDGRTLLIAHSVNGQVYTVNPTTGATRQITGLDVPTADGLILKNRHLWVVQNTNQITRFKLSVDLRSGVQQKVITSPDFGYTTTAARFGTRLAAVNGHFDTGFPPTSPTYEIVVVKF